MKKYLRFGEIPQNGKSINFLKLSFRQSEDFSWFLKNGDIDGAYAELPKECFEKGLSVFEMGKDGLPALKNLMQISSLLSRIDAPIYEVSGEEVGRGNDGEPLIEIAQIEKRRKISVDKLCEHVLSVMLANFEHAEYDPAEDERSNRLFNFTAEYKINRKTGEKVSRWEETSGSDWVIMPSYKEYKLNGWTFSSPQKNFETYIGYREAREDLSAHSPVESMMGRLDQAKKQAKAQAQARMLQKNIETPVKVKKNKREDI